MFKVNNKDNWRRSEVFIVNFEHITDFFSSVYVIDFEQVMLAGKMLWSLWGLQYLGIISKLRLFFNYFIINSLKFA